MEVSSREVVRLLHGAGLRRRKEAGGADPVAGSSAAQLVGLEPLFVEFLAHRHEPGAGDHPWDGALCGSTVANRDRTSSRASAHFASARSASVA